MAPAASVDRRPRAIRMDRHSSETTPRISRVLPMGHNRVVPMDHNLQDLSAHSRVIKEGIRRLPQPKVTTPPLVSAPASARRQPPHLLSSPLAGRQDTIHRVYHQDLLPRPLCLLQDIHRVIPLPLASTAAHNILKGLLLKATIWVLLRRGIPLRTTHTEVRLRVGVLPPDRTLSKEGPGKVFRRKIQRRGPLQMVWPLRALKKDREVAGAPQSRRILLLHPSESVCWGWGFLTGEGDEEEKRVS